MLATEFNSVPHVSTSRNNETPHLLDPNPEVAKRQRMTKSMQANADLYVVL